jgi:uncharacterized membrane protein YoaT (DUF817 family)
MATVIHMYSHLKTMCMYWTVKDLSASVYINNQVNMYSGNALWILARLPTVLLRFCVVFLPPSGKCQETISNHNTTTFFHIFTNHNISAKFASLFLLRASVRSLLCYVQHLQGEPLITCTKPSAFYCVLCVINRLCYRQRKLYYVYPWLRNALPQPCVS